MTDQIRDYLLAWARLDGPAKVLAEARRRLEAGKLGQRAHLDLPLTPGERAQVGRLLSPTWAAGAAPLRVADLRAALAANGATLEALLVAVGGPLRDLPAERARTRASVRTNHEAGVEILGSVLGVLAGQSAEIAADASRATPDFGNGETGITSPSGLAPHESEGITDPKTRAQLAHILRGYPDWVETAGQVKAVVAAARADETGRLPVLAARLWGDAHALDRDTALGRACARVLALAATVATASSDCGDESDATGATGGTDATGATDAADGTDATDAADGTDATGATGGIDATGAADGTDATDTAGTAETAGEVNADGTTDKNPEYVDPLGDAGAWRAAWASLGVACDEVSAQVLVLNLPLEGDAPAVALAGATPGEPTWLTLRSLRGELRLAAGVTEVFVCENPSIVEAAADTFGAQSKPLVCTFGFPNQATLTLLAALAGAGTRLWVRADADAAGWNIVKQLMNFENTARWRMPDGQRGYEEEFIAELLSDLERR